MLHSAPAPVMRQSAASRTSYGNSPRMQPAPSAPKVAGYKVSCCLLQLSTIVIADHLSQQISVLISF